MKGGVLKALFKAALEAYLPRDILYRPKRGFGCPIDRWFRHELKDMAMTSCCRRAHGSANCFAPILCADCSTSIAATPSIIRTAFGRC